MQRIALYTADGRFVAHTETLSFNRMPEVVLWGERLFVLQQDTAQVIVPRYTEAFYYAVPPDVLFLKDLKPPQGPSAPGHQTQWLAEMGYATWRKILAQEDPIIAPTLPETLEASQPMVQRAWRAAAAAIRRRVVSWKLPAEEEEPES